MREWRSATFPSTNAKERCEECITRRRRSRKPSWCDALRGQSMTSSSTCGLRRRRSSSISQWSSPRRTGECYMSLKISLTGSRRCRTTPRLSTRWGSGIRRNTREACAGTIRPSGFTGRRASGSSSNATRIIPISFREYGRKDLNAQKPQDGFDPLAEGQAMFRLIEELYPISPTIPANRFRHPLPLLQRQIPLELREVRTGTQVFDWTVPKEWNIRGAYVKNAQR